jgi:hypothetical protein
MAIASAVVGERRSKVLVRDQGVLKAAVELLTKPYPVGSAQRGASEGLPGKLMMESLVEDCDATLVSQLLDKDHTKEAVGVAALSLISSCLEGPGGESYAHFVASDVQSLSAILSTLPSQLKKDTPPLVQVGIVRQFTLASSLFRDLCLIDTCRDLVFKHTIGIMDAHPAKLTETFRFFPETEAEITKKKKQEEKKKKLQSEVVKAPDPVLAFANALQCTQSYDKMSQKCSTELTEARESAVAALANLALHTAMRSRFQPALLPLLQVATHVKTATKGKKAVESIRDESAAAMAFALAALMNTLISEDSMKQVLCDHGAVDSLLVLLREMRGSAYGVIRVRAAGLLSRLVSVPSALNDMRKESSVAVISAAIHSNETEYIKKKEQVRDPPPPTLFFQVH